MGRDVRSEVHSIVPGTVLKPRLNLCSQRLNQVPIHSSIFYYNYPKRSHLKS